LFYIHWIIWDVAVQYSTFTVVRRNQGETIATAKTTTLTFRIEPELKEALRTAAEREYRSIANMVAVLIMDYCERNDIPVELDPADRRKGAAK
jgi:hypothetical protein|tara:strand:- start:221 stop:499 length:279 start_codon:yes stop_codon:yes gene_type:complete